MSGLTGGCCRYAFGGFRDVDGEVADPLEVGVDLDRGDDRPQVRRHRLVEGQEFEAAVIDLDVETVDRFVTDEQPVDRVQVAAREAPHRLDHPLLGESAHREQAFLQSFELFLEMPSDSFHRGSLIRTDRSRSPL